MRVRVVSALAGLGILAVVFVFLDTLLLNTMVGLVSALAVLELLKAAGLARYLALTALSMAGAMLLPFVRQLMRADYAIYFALLVFCLFIIVYSLILFKNRKTMDMGRMVIAFLCVLSVPVFFSCAVFIRDGYHLAQSTFYLLVALGAAWLSDSGAYFVGVFFGKHKLAPKISPKKTVEGFIGGVVTCTLCLLLISFVYTKLLAAYGAFVRPDYLLLACLAPVFSVVGMLGDLLASAFKRKFGIKDFGNIMPGHGGILDRFDSVLLTVPAVYFTLRYLDSELMRLLYTV